MQQANHAHIENTQLNLVQFGNVILAIVSKNTGNKIFTYLK